MKPSKPRRGLNHLVVGEVETEPLEVRSLEKTTVNVGDERPIVVAHPRRSGTKVVVAKVGATLLEILN